MARVEAVAAAKVTAEGAAAKAAVANPVVEAEATAAAAGRAGPPVTHRAAAEQTHLRASSTVSE